MSEQLQGRELDAALARALGYELKDPPPFSHFKGATWRKPNNGAWCADGLPMFHRDLNAMHEIEAEIDQHVGIGIYLKALITEACDGLLMFDFDGNVELDDIFKIAHATAEQRARAALAVLTTQGG